MAEFFTYAQIKAKVQDDLDLSAEDFVDDSELLGYVNEAIDEAESHIHTLGMEAEYFRKRFALQLVVGQEEILLPTDIYANKILGVTYNDGSLIYEMKRVRGMNFYNKIANAQHFSNSDDYYQYVLLNETAGEGAKMLLMPKSRIISSTTVDGADGNPQVVMWYIRQANRLAIDTDVCDIPEFFHFIIKFAKWMVLFKESHPNMGVAKEELREQRDMMIDTLATMVPDKDSEIVPDLTMYTDIS